MAITFQRAALYEEVWSEPLTKLAKRYGLSDNGLRKICRAMSIPVPGVGYWARLAAGQSVARTALPSNAARTSFTTHPAPPSDSGFHTPEDETWLGQRDEYEARADSLIQVTDAPTRWHPVASTLRKRTEERLREIRRWEQAAQRAAKRSERERARTPDFESANWRMFVRDGQLLMDAPLRITPESHERALRLANALCFASEKRGFSVSLTENPARIELSGHGTTLQLRISEKLGEKIVREPAYSGGPLENTKSKVPTGILRIYADRERSIEREVAADDGKGKLESKLNGVFMRINRMIVRGRERQREREDWERSRELEATRREIRARREALARKRRAQFHREVRDWHRAERIREYVAHIVASFTPAGADDPAMQRLRLWQSWANTLASRWDPTARRFERFRSGSAKTLRAPRAKQ